MPDRYPMLLLRALLWAFVLVGLPAQAQYQPQYRVELLVFSNPAGSTAEQWDATPELDYPRNIQFLSSAEGFAAPAPPAATASATPQTTPAATAVTESPPPAAPSPTAYVMLPASQRELAANAAALQHSGRYHILFHEAWTQPIPGQAAAVPIVLDRSGDGGPWPALQGWIKIYQAGAFFLDTNLWLNTSGEYLPGNWRMPPPPRAPASLPMEPSSLPMAATMPPAQPGVAPATTDLPPAEPVAADYPYRHAVLLKQSRKMRAGQLNYIDHPLLGVLVKITPMAVVEPAAAPAPGDT